MALNSFKNKSNIARRGEGGHPLGPLHRQMDRLFDDFFGGFDLSPMRHIGGWDQKFVPNIEVSDSEKELTVTAELPGLDEKDIELSLERGVLTIKGQKKDQKEEKDKGYYYSERSFGSFSRSISLPAEVDEEKADAKFKKGVLSISLPKISPEKAKKIAIKGE